MIVVVKYLYRQIYKFPSPRKNMFNSFKEKLKNLLGKGKKEEEIVEKPKRKRETEKKPKEKKKEVPTEKEDLKEEKGKKGKLMLEETEGILSKEIEKIDKEEIKELPLKEEFNAGLQKYEPNLEEVKKTAEELEEENKEEIEEAIEDLEEEVKEKKESKEEPKQGFFSKIKSKLQSVEIDQETFDEFFEKLEMVLLENNVALEVADEIKKTMEKTLIHEDIKQSEIEDRVKKSLKESIESILIEPFDLIDKINQKQEEPFVILFFGINGAGKTTTIAKVANLLKENKISTVLAAGDTFRAASIEQLQKHGEKLGIKVINQNYGADPAAVGFDAIKYAKAHNIKTVLIDTAGRMHTKADLLREMEKIIRVTNPDLKIFVAESITGNDAVEQAKTFDKSFGIDASILSKADVDEKGGTSISIGHVTGKPILFLGTGQDYNDLEKFDPKEIVSRLGLD